MAQKETVAMKYPRNVPQKAVRGLRAKRDFFVEPFYTTSFNASTSRSMSSFVWTSVTQ